MFEARIVAPTGSLYFADEATPYALETLRQHLREYQPEGQRDVALELIVEDGPTEPMVNAWLGSLSAAGYDVHVRRQPQHGAASPS